MNEFLVITAIGADRPGLVDDLSRILLNENLNIEDSRMSVLGGEFAIILLVSGNPQAIQQIQDQQQLLEQALQLNLLIKSTAGRVTAENTIAYEIKVNGMDHPGIVNRLARFLSQHSINIEDLETESYPAAHTGTPMFAVEMTVDIP
ncbi:MAG: glycine cleavage system protein R, partial [Gammaproteobacteria bacterium]|nr:glycine cleavage system protein R [Gammaproteobacteria bacterium]